MTLSTYLAGLPDGLLTYRPKIPIRGYFDGPRNGKNAKVFGYLGIPGGPLVYFMAL
jgi:hypothetical protein